MKVQEPVAGTIVISYDGWALTRLTFVFAVLFLGIAGYDVFIGARGTDRLIGLLAAAGTCLAVAIIFLEKASFEFVRTTQTITWCRRWALRQDSGTIPFAAVQSVHAERPLGDDGTPSRRVIFRTTDGAEIPLTVGYQPDPNGEVLKIAERIREVLGHSSEQVSMQEVERLVISGKKLEAIRVLREDQDLSLSEAKQRVDELSAKKTS
jgi:hypothetical protein